MYAEYSPCIQLIPYVDCYWEFKGKADYQSMVSIPPYGCADFIFTIKNTINYTNNTLTIKNNNAYFIGPMNKCTELAISPKDTHVFGVRFLPGGLYHLLGIPLNALTNYNCLASDLFEYFDSYFLERICEAKDSENIITLVQNKLLKQLSIINEPIDNRIVLSINKIQKDQGKLSITSLASDICLCQRHLERKFKVHTGYTPKEYSRIIQFWNATKILNKFTVDNLLSVAIESGYYDASHLIREFKRLSGKTPYDFVKASTKTNSKMYCTM